MAAFEPSVVPAAGPAPGTETDNPAVELPRRATRVELVGPMQGMSYAERKWLICLDGSHYVHATELLYHLLLHADGKTGVDEIARRVSADTGRAVSGDEIRWLVVNKLGGSGLLERPAEPSGHAPSRPRSAAGSQRSAPRPQSQPADNRILAIKYRLPLLPYPVTAPLTAVLQNLYWPPLIVLVVLAAGAINVRIYTGTDFQNALLTLFYRPEIVLLLFAVDSVTRIFHELGHASALRRAGARHGTIGFALYLVFPVYYTDVTHAYRLNRLQRIRVDLGGIYFDLISMIGLFAAYEFTAYTPLLLMITLIGLGILRQFTPFIRFDGYYLIADLMGVPDPMPLLGALVADHLPWRWHRRRSLPTLSRTALAILWGYFLLIVVFLTRPLLLLAVAGGAILQTLPGSGFAVVAEFLFAWRHDDFLTRVAATLELVFWALIPVGLGLFAFSMLRLVARGLILLGHTAHRRLASLELSPPPPPAAAAAAPVTARRAGNLPTALDGLGRPVQQPDNAPIEATAARVQESGDSGLDQLAEELKRAYFRRLEEMAGDISRQLESIQALEREREHLRLRVECLESAVTSLTGDLRRIGTELLVAANAGEELVDHGASS